MVRLASRGGGPKASSVSDRVAQLTSSTRGSEAESGRPVRNATAEAISSGASRRRNADVSDALVKRLRVEARARQRARNSSNVRGLRVAATAGRERGLPYPLLP